MPVSDGEAKALTAAVKELTGSVDSLLAVLAAREFYPEEERAQLFQEYRKLRNIHISERQNAENVYGTEDRSLQTKSNRAVEDAWKNVLKFHDEHPLIARISKEGLPKKAHF